MPGSTRSFLLLACSLAALALTDAKLTTGSSKSGISLANNADIQALETPISSSSSSLAKVVAAAAATVSSSSSIDMKATLSLVGMFVTWYAFNAGYNVYNAFMKRDFAFPYSTAAAQLLVGLFYAIPLWLLKLRKAPSMNKEDVIALLPIAFLNALGETYST